MLNKEEKDQSTAAEIPVDTNNQNLVLYTIYMLPEIHYTTSGRKEKTREKKRSEENEIKSSRVVVYEYNLIRSEIDKLVPYTGSSIYAHVVGVKLPDQCIYIKYSQHMYAGYLGQ